MAACEPSLDEIRPDGGTSDFTRFVSLGDSYIAGYADGELYRSGQVNSISNILASQLQLVGAGTFQQPLMFDEYGFGKRKVLDYTYSCEGDSFLFPVTSSGVPNIGNFINISGQGPYQNIGVHGAKSFHLLSAAYGSPAQGNLYYIRFASEPGYSTMVGDAIAQDPTFFLLGTGTYDVLRYAINGGTQDSITSVAHFRECMDEIADSLTTGTAEGVILNVPDVTKFPYFNTISTRIPYDGWVLSGEEALKMNQMYAHYEEILATMGFTWDYPFSFTPGANAYIIRDNDIPLPSPYNVRQMEAGDRFLLSLPADSLLCEGWCVPEEGDPKAIPQRYVLTASVTREVQEAIDQYNAIIGEVAQSHHLILADIAGFFQSVENGVVYDGIHFDGTFISGGFYSLDGIQLSQRGNALAANFIISLLNQHYQASIPKVNPGDYQGIFYP